MYCIGGCALVCAEAADVGQQRLFLQALEAIAVLLALGGVTELGYLGLYNI